MKQKIIKVGNSAAVTIPQKFLKEVGWKPGDELLMEGDSRTGILILKDEDSPYKSKITPEFKQWLDDFTSRNKSLLEELAKK